MFQSPFYRLRRPLSNFYRAVRSGSATIGFIGGSITDSRSRAKWSDVVIRNLCAKYPEVSFHIVNAAIGGTDSIHGVFRAEKDLVPYNCDLIFIEYAVNDAGLPTELRNRSREGLVRKLWRADCDLVFTYTFERPMLEDMLALRLPASIAELEDIADHYQIPSVFMSCYALDCLKKGLLRWEEWLPDGLHPDSCGSRYYAAPVIDMLEDPAACSEASQALLPQPMFEGQMGPAVRLPFSEIKRSGYWFIHHPIDTTLVDTMLSTSALGSALDFSFEGTGVVICTSWGTCAADYRWRIDDGPWQISKLSRPDLPDWPGKWGWTRTNVLADHLKPGLHHLHIEPYLHQDEDCKGINFDLCYIGIFP